MKVTQVERDSSSLNSEEDRDRKLAGSTSRGMIEIHISIYVGWFTFCPSQHTNETRVGGVDESKKHQSAAVALNVL